ncbi:MAG: TIGR00270 family protein [Thermoplasmatales archaeon]|jgi:putative transcription factor|nr:TIGR00270 family protein [Thermoplasmatales archaeon]
MICEMCGKEVPATKPVFIDKTKLNLCGACAKFGDEQRESKGTAQKGPSAQAIENRLQNRERRMQTRDIYSQKDSRHLRDDYGDVIKAARLDKGMSQEDFAASIGIKKGMLSKIEANNMIPEDKLVSRMEKALGISLMENVTYSGGTSGSSGGKMTLQDFIRRE